MFLDSIVGLKDKLIKNKQYQYLSLICMLIIMLPWIVPSDAALFFEPASAIVSVVLISFVIVLFPYKEMTWSIKEASIWLGSYALYTLLTNLWAASFTRSLEITTTQIAIILFFIMIKGKIYKLKHIIALSLSITGVALYVYAMGVDVHWWQGIDAVYGNHQLASVFQYHNTFAAVEISIAIISIMLGLYWNNWWINSFSNLAFMAGIASVIGSSSRTMWVISFAVIVLYLFIQFRYEKNTWTSWIKVFVLLASLLVSGLTIFVLTKSSSNLLLITLAVSLLLAIGIAKLQQIVILKNVNRKYAWISLIVLTIIFFVGIFVERHRLFKSTGSLLHRLNTINFSNVSLQERFYYYGNAFHMWLNSPIWGSGGGTWGAKFQAYQTLPYWSEQAHSIIVDTILNGGIIGVILIVLCGVFLIKQWFITFREANDPSQKYTLLAGLFGAAIIVIHSIVDFDFAYGYVQILFVIMLALAFKPKEKQKEDKKLIKRFNITFVALSSVTLILSLSVSVSQSLVTAVTNNTPDGILQSNQQAALWAPYNGQIQLNLANYYLQTAATSQDSSLYLKAWNAAQAAHYLSPWNPSIQTSAAIIAYQLRQNSASVQWAMQAIHDANFNETAYRNLLGLLMWTSAEQIKTNYDAGKQGLLQVIATYHDLQSKMKIANTKLFPDSISLNLDASIQVYVGAAYMLLHEPQKSLAMINPLLTTNRDQSAISLYEIETVLDQQLLHIQSKSYLQMMSQIKALPQTLSEYKFLKSIIGL